MATQGPNSGSSFTQNDTGDTSWVNLSNLAASDNSYAMITGNGTADTIVATGFGFSIPAGATINGITVEVERKRSADLYNDESVVLTLDGSTEIGSNKADTGTNYPTSDAYKTYGSGSDLWGLVPSVSDINASTFGVMFKPALSNGGVASVVSVDNIRITITYTLADRPFNNRMQQFLAGGH